jgi:hypothetical protein
MFVETLEYIIIIIIIIIINIAKYWSHQVPHTWNYIVCHIILVEHFQCTSLALMDQYRA